MTDRPNDIPQDVWDKAAAVGEAIHGRHERGFILWPLISEAGPAPQEIVARAILSARPAAVEDGPGEYRPTLTRNEAASFTEFVTEDVPALYGPMEARNVEVVMRLQGPRGEVLGYRIYDPSPTEGEAR
jgi:hypothetical protein